MYARVLCAAALGSLPGPFSLPSPSPAPGAFDAAAPVLELGPQIPGLALPEPLPALERGLWDPLPPAPAPEMSLLPIPAEKAAGGALSAAAEPAAAPAQRTGAAAVLHPGESRPSGDSDEAPSRARGPMATARTMAAWFLPSNDHSGDLPDAAPAGPGENALDDRLARLKVRRRAPAGADAKRIVEFINRQRLAYGYIPPPPEVPGSVDSDLADLEANYDGKRGEFVVIENPAGEIVGTAAFIPIRDGVVELRKVYLDPSIRGGTGWLLVKHLIDLARSRGYRRMELETITSMKEAVKLYLRLGFQRFERPGGHPGIDLFYYLDL